MKILLALRPLLVISSALHAQNQICISANPGYSVAWLLNKSDRQSGLVKTGISPKPSFGISLSYINPAKKGFQGFSVGIGYAQYYQSTTSDGETLTPRTSAETHSDLHYLRLPVSARFGPGRKGKWEPYIEAGLYAGFLLSYEEYFKTSYKDYSTTGWMVRQQEVTVRNKTMEDETRVVGPQARYYQVILLDEGIYRTFDWGAQATLGTRYRISKRLLAGLGLHISYGFGDMERKGELKYSDPYTRQFIQFRGNSFWDYNTPKATPNYAGRQERSATHLFIAGLQLSIQYPL